MSKSTADLIAEFQARGGKVQKAATGEGIGLTNRQWYRLSKGEPVRGIKSENDLIEERHTDGAGVVRNGLGEIIGRV